MASNFNPINFVNSVVEEAKKVVWPTREMVVRHTATVIISVAIASVIFAGVDYGFQKLVILALRNN